MKRRHSGDGGAVLISSLFALVLMFVFLSSLMTLNALRAAGGRQASRNLEAYYAARAGIEAALHFMEGKRAETDSVPGVEITLREPGGAHRSDEIFYVHFHERGDGRLKGTVFERAECEVVWARDEEGAYIMESSGRVTFEGPRRAEATVYARVEEQEGKLKITGWFE